MSPDSGERDQHTGLVYLDALDIKLFCPSHCDMHLF